MDRGWPCLGIATQSYLWGSVLFLVGAIFSLLGTWPLGRNPSRRTRARAIRENFIAAWLFLLGAALFVVGSFFYLFSTYNATLYFCAAGPAGG